MTARGSFSDAEFVRLCEAPMIAASAIAFVDGGGLRRASAVVNGALGVIDEVVKRGDRSPLVVDVGRGVTERRDQGINPMANFRPTGPDALEKIADELTSVLELVGAKSTPAEETDFRQFLLDAAQGAAKATKKGGFLGLGGKREITEAEQEMLNQMDAALPR